MNNSKNNRNNKNNGITMIAIVVTVIVMMIIAAIAVYEGQEIINKSKIQTLLTNMHTIQAKVKAYSEEIDSKVWALPEGDGENQKGGKRRKLFEEKDLEYVNKYEYSIKGNGLIKMGLDDLAREEYTVQFDYDYVVKDIVFNAGIKYHDADYHLLSEIENLLKSED